jgi:hypothetical protein
MLDVSGLSWTLDAVDVDAGDAIPLTDDIATARNL